MPWRAAAGTLLVFLVAFLLLAQSAQGFLWLLAVHLLVVLGVLLPVSAYVIADRDGIPLRPVLLRALCASPLLALFFLLPLLSWGAQPVGTVAILMLYVTAVGSSRSHLLARGAVALVLTAAAVLPFHSGLTQLTLTGPDTGLGRLTLDGPDDFANVHASLIYLSTGLSQGDLPFWNQANWMGNPFGADPMWGSWYPVNFLSAGLAAAWMHARPDLTPPEIWDQLLNHYRLVISLLTVTGMYVLLRSFRLPRLACLLGAVPFAFNVHPVQMQFTWTWALLPWLLYGVWRVFETGRLSMAVFTGLLLGTCLLSGQAQAIYYTLAAVAVIALCVLVFPPDPDRPRVRLTRLVLLLVLTAAIGGFAGAILWYPAMEYTAEAHRWITGRMLPAREPLLYSDTLVVCVEGLDGLAVALYCRLGATGLFFLVVGLLRPRPWVIVVAGVGAVFALASVGDHSFVHPLLFDFWPGWRMFRCLLRATTITYFCGGILVAWGAAVYLRSPSTLRALLGLTFALGCWALFPQGGYHPGLQPPTAVSRYGDMAVATALALGALALAWWGAAREGPQPRLGSLPGVALLAVAVLAVLVWQTDQSKALYRHPWPETGLIRMAEDLDRVLRPALRSDPPFRIDPRRAPTLSLFCGFYFDWDTLGCYGGLAHVKTADLTWNASPQDNNVRYLITDRGAPSPPLPPEAKLVYQNPWFLLYEVPTYAARYRVGQQARGPAAGPPTPVFIHRSRRNEVVLDIPAGEHDSLWVTAPFHRRWKATVNGRPAPLTENRKLQRIPLPAHQYCRVRVFYSDPLLFFFLSVSALVALGFVMAVWGHLVLPLGRGPGGAGSVRGTTAAPGIAHATSFR